MHKVFISYKLLILTLFFSLDGITTRGCLSHQINECNEHVCAICKVDRCNGIFNAEFCTVNNCHDIRDAVNRDQSAPTSHILRFNAFAGEIIEEFDEQATDESAVQTDGQTVVDIIEKIETSVDAFQAITFALRQNFAEFQMIRASYS